MKVFMAATVATLLAIGFAEVAQAQSGTCSGAYQICLDRVRSRNPNAPASTIQRYDAECVAAKSSCLRTGTWNHNTANIPNLKKQ
jgi:hypothetical protein